MFKFLYWGDLRKKMAESVLHIFSSFSCMSLYFNGWLLGSVASQVVFRIHIRTSTSVRLRSVMSWDIIDSLCLATCVVSPHTCIDAALLERISRWRKRILWWILLWNIGPYKKHPSSKSIIHNNEYYYPVFGLFGDCSKLMFHLAAMRCRLWPFWRPGNWWRWAVL